MDGQSYQLEYVAAQISDGSAVSGLSIAAAITPVAIQLTDSCRRVVVYLRAHSFAHGIIELSTKNVQRCHLGGILLKQQRTLDLPYNIGGSRYVR